MLEKILQKLKTQRGQNSQVSDKTLESMAKTWANVIKDDETLNGIDFTEQISSLQGNIGHIAKQVKEDTEKLLKKPEPTPTPAPTPKPNEPKPDDMPEWAKALIDQNQKNADLLAKMQGEKITTTRTQELNELLKDAPKAYKDSVFAGFNKAQFADDDDFNAFKEIQKTNYESFQQMAKEQGVVFNTPSPSKKPADDGRDSTLAAASKIAAEAKKQQQN